MNNYLLHLADLPRRLHFPIPLDSLVSYENATGTFNGIRPGNIEFALRLESSDKFAIDFQNSIRYENQFPHLFIKLPHSRFRTNKFLPRKIFALIYDGKHLDTLRGEGIPLEKICWPVKDTSLIQWTVDKIDELVEKLHLPGVVDQLDSLAWNLLHEAVLAGTDTADGTECVQLRKIQHIASFYRRHYAEKIDLNVLLSHHGLSRRTFYRYWAQFFDFTPKQFQLALRLQEAARLLSYDNSISEIAEKLNFADLSYFTEQFKHYWGMTPSMMKKPASSLKKNGAFERSSL